MQQQVLMDKLSEFLAVEQGGLQLYRVASERATDRQLKQHYDEFGQQTARHRAVLMDLIARLGGDPNYVSPCARLAQVKASQLLGVTLVVDGLSPQEIEANDLENLLLAETKDHADWELLSRLVDQAGDSETASALSEAVQQVEAQEDEHLTWAREMLANLGLRAVQEGPAPKPERWQAVISAPEPPISAVHPAPEGRDLLEGSQKPQWQEPLVARSVAAA